ncbi:type IV pilus biogenesis protein PilM [Paraburkholderia fungorum]|uniref:type IV pilus biogenesis protein PilM n=1 Tax=Paraburkholderia fungorum TaxID=134537 RepID=UPI001622C459|nr:type IV pilus biogenesis protein PilM [Paraburkholderia fungorum]MBB5547433.1 hypothetical protein [Paraburkholderia fungorum]
MALFVFAMLSVALTLARHQASSSVPNVQVVNIASAAAQFLNYRSAVMAFMGANPTYTGTLSTSQLAPYNHGFSASFTSQYAAGNAISAISNGYEVTVYAALPVGTLETLLEQTGDDVSFGVSAGSTWTSKALEAGVVPTPQPLNTSLASAGDIVSVFESRN